MRKTFLKYCKSSMLCKVALTALLLFPAMNLLGNGSLAAKTITGKVISASDNEPIIGASVLVKETKVGAATDIDGNFKVEAKDGSTLVISYVGFNTKTIRIAGQSVINVVLTENTKSLDEVVVVGYGTQKKKLLTGANLQVKGDEISKEAVTNPLQALQGKASGVQITAISGAPGQTINMTIRGAGSIYGNNPLYVVDGVETSDISYIAPSDIASIDVLKDAASAAIYGAQASNGVVLITTKTGTKGAAKVSFDMYYGWQNLAKKVKLLNADQYATIQNEALINDGKDRLFGAGTSYATKADYLAKYANTDWLDAIFKDNAPMYDYTLGVNGGSDTGIYSLSLDLTGQDGIVGGHDVSSYQRTSFRVNTENKMLDNMLKVGEHLSFIYTDYKGFGEGNTYSNSPIRTALGTSPFLPMYDDSGNYLDNSTNASVYNGSTWVPWDDSEYNASAYMNMTDQAHTKAKRLIGDVYAELTPIKNLTIKTQFGLESYSSNYRQYLPIYHLSKYIYQNNTKASQSMSDNTTWIWDNTIKYDFKIKEHNFSAMLGMQAKKYNGEYVSASNSDLVATGYDYAYVNNGTAQTTDPTNTTLYSLGGAPSDESMTNSYFGRINWDYKETYMATATFRADGSSRFAKGHRWGYFPSVSAGWVISNEKFMENTKSWLDFLKIRASWGQVGNQNISAYQYMALISTTNVNYNFGQSITSGHIDQTSANNSVGAYASQMANEKLKWETSEQLDFGFDARFLNSRLSANFDLYRKTTKDWLVKAPVLATTGADAPYINGGNVVNKGVELGLGWNDQFNGFKYSVNANISYNHNEVTKIADGVDYISGNSNQIYNNADACYRLAEVGHPVGYFWGYKTNGILQNADEVAAYCATLNYNGASTLAAQKKNSLQGTNLQAGDVRFVDMNNDGRIDENDKTQIGNPNPKFVFGLSLNCSYKDFDFSLTANGVAGVDILQSYRNWSGYTGNYTTAIVDRWHGEGTSNTMPRVTTGSGSANYSVSDLFVQNGSYLRISNIQLGYNFAKLLNCRFISQCRLYVAIQNLYTFTKYDGFDPEIGTWSSSSSSAGVDCGTYPHPRTFMIGANLKF